jgi:16S rRNA G966 N2-methylase RsmD
VLADPPYNVSDVEVNDMITALAQNNWTTVGTVVVVERGTGSPALAWPDGWRVWPTRSYGDTRLDMAERI